jgi:DNA-binding response OmpR family regulator/two-component sensor histidine kinase
LDQVKSNFFANISHEFRTPLSLIAGPIQQQLQKEDITAQERQNLQIAQRNSTRLVTLVDQLLDLSKLESGHFSLKVQQGNLDSFLKSLTGSFDFIAQENEHTYTKQISVEGTNHWFDTDALEKIITNLISNAIKYSPSGESISVSATAQNRELQLTIKNSGAQLPQEILSTLFNRFQRADETTAGTGIGLALTKELVTLHKGSITVKSDTDWTTFMVALPLSESVFTTSEKAEGVSSDYAFAKSNLRDSRPSGERSSKAKPQPTLEHPLVDEVDIFSKDEKPILLIVDDNEDLRTYVSSLFNESHTIHTAVNGKEGFEKALSEVPDLIITDLMMPEDDGIMLTQNCKTTEATSHIPVLMLTAKAGDKNKLIGLETGADAYLTKPFNTEILKTTVHNLQETRDKLQERFSQEVVLLPKDIATNSTDERFLTNLQEVMDKSLIESDFNTEAFAEAVGMSRMQLHRKLKALTGLSATEFIRGQRLKLAAQMLKKSDINVSQVGYAVGFNNHSYFTKCFKEKYGISPSEYSKKS